VAALVSEAGHVLEKVGDEAVIGVVDDGRALGSLCCDLGLRLREGGGVDVEAVEVVLQVDPVGGVLGPGVGPEDAADVDVWGSGGPLHGRTSIKPRAAPAMTTAGIAA
jgi:hypothetical protein